jgi:hypothetical protein
MANASETFSAWLSGADIAEQRLSAFQQHILQAAHCFRQSRGSDYYSTRLLSHFLLHCGCGLKVAQVARLLRLSRPTASRQQGTSSKEAIQQAHHRLDGRPHGKLLPRFAGPIAGFLHAHPRATRYDLLDFIAATFAVRVSRVALWHFLKRYGLDSLAAAAADQQPPAPALPAEPPPQQASPQPAELPAGSSAELLPLPAPPFCRCAPSTPAPSC